MDEILDGDAVVILATVTAAGGVVLSPLSNFGLRDREAGVLRSVNASVATRKKLDPISANPSVAVAYHTRAHGFGNRPEYVLVQGTASLGRSVPDYPPTIRDVWERYAGQGTADVWDPS